MPVQQMRDCPRCGHTIRTDVPEPKCSQCGKKVPSTMYKALRTATADLALAASMVDKGGINGPEAAAEQLRKKGYDAEVLHGRLYVRNSQGGRFDVDSSTFGYLMERRGDPKHVYEDLRKARVAKGDGHTHPGQRRGEPFGKVEKEGGNTPSSLRVNTNRWESPRGGYTRHVTYPNHHAHQEQGGWVQHGHSGGGSPHSHAGGAEYPLDGAPSGRRTKLSD